MIRSEHSTAKIGVCRTGCPRRLSLGAHTSSVPCLPGPAKPLFCWGSQIASTLSHLLYNVLDWPGLALKRLSLSAFWGDPAPAPSKTQLLSAFWERPASLPQKLQFLSAFWRHLPLTLPTTQR